MNKHKILGNRARLMLLLFLTLIAAFWIWGYVSSEGLINKIIELIQRYESNRSVFFSLGIFWLFAVASVLLGPFTSAPLVPIALLLWGNWVTYWILFSGWITGAIITYTIGRHLGRAIVLKIISPEKANAWQEFISSRVTFLIAFLFRLAMPAETGYIFGLARYNFLKYIFITTLIESLTATILIFSGKALIDRNFVTFISWIAIVVILLSTSSYLLAHKIKKGRKASVQSNLEEKIS